MNEKLCCCLWCVKISPAPKMVLNIVVHIARVFLRKRRDRERPQNVDRVEAESGVLWAVWTRRPDLPAVDRLTRAAKRRGVRTVTVTTGIGDEGARHLAALTGLKSLNVSRNRIGAEGARHLAALTCLTSLNVFGNHIGAEGARHLAALTCLTNLNVGQNEIGAEGARHLAASLIGCDVRA